MESDLPPVNADGALVVGQFDLAWTTFLEAGRASHAASCHIASMILDVTLIEQRKAAYWAALDRLEAAISEVQVANRVAQDYPTHTLRR